MLSVHAVCFYASVQCGACRLIKILTAAVALLIASIQTIIVSVTLPQGPYAAMIMALELITTASR